MPVNFNDPLETSTFRKAMLDKGMDTVRVDKFIKRKSAESSAIDAVQTGQITPDFAVKQYGKGILPKLTQQLGSILSEEDQKSISKSDKVASAARNVLNILDQIESGQLVGKDAETALNFAGGAVAESSFDVGGKALTPNEQALLQGTRPTIQIKQQSVLDKITGRVPPQTAQILDDHDTLRQKMEMAINLTNQAKSRLQGQDVPPITQGLTLTGQQAGGLPPPIQGALSLIVKPIISGIKGYAELLGTAAGSVAYVGLSKTSPETAQSLADILEPIVERKYATPGQTIITGGLQTLGGVGAAFDLATLGQGSVVKQTLGLGARNMMINAPIFGVGSALQAVRTKKDPEEAFWKGATGQSPIGPFVGVFGESPETEAADIAATIIVPIIGGRMVEKFMTGHAMKPVNVKDMESKIKETFLRWPGRDIGKKATSILTLKAGDKASVVKAEEMAINAIAITKSNSVRGIAKELPKLKKSSGEYITARLSELDDTTSFSPLYVQNKIINQVADSTAAQAYPKAFENFKAIIGNSILSQSAKEAGVVSMNGSTINGLRKSMNKGVGSNWFSSGMPIKSSGEALQSMKWTASNVVKDIITETDGYEDIGQAIALQHYAMAGEPVYSNTALSPKSSLVGGIWGSVINFSAQGINAIVTPMKISSVRRGMAESPITTMAEKVRALPPQPAALPGGGGLPTTPAPLMDYKGLPVKPTMIKYLTR